MTILLIPGMMMMRTGMMIISAAMQPVLAAHVLLTLSSCFLFKNLSTIKIILDDYLDWDYLDDHHYEAISVNCNRLSCQETYIVQRIDKHDMVSIKNPNKI